MAIKTQILYTTSDGNQYFKKTIANRHERYLQAKESLSQNIIDLEDKEEVGVEDMAILDIVNSIGIEQLTDLLKDFQLGPQPQ